MIKLLELISQIIRNKNEEGLIPVDNWRATHAMYLEDIGFKNDGMFYYSLKKPEMKLSYKKNEGFILEDKSKNENQTFQKFQDIEEFFMNYKQKWDSQLYTENVIKPTVIRTKDRLERTRHGEHKNPTIIPAGSMGIIKDMMGYGYHNRSRKGYVIKFEKIGGLFTLYEGEFVVVPSKK